MIKTHSSLRKRRGQALAEMAVMVPFLVIGMMGFLDLGRAFYYQIAITNAVREGARYAAQPLYLGLNPICASPPQPPGANCVTPDDAAIQLHVIHELTGTGISMQPSDIQVMPDQVGRVNYVIGPQPQSQYPITVMATFKFKFITPIIGTFIGDPLTIKTSSVFRADY
jgi:hypothetical protein